MFLVLSNLGLKTINKGRFFNRAIVFSMHRYGKAMLADYFPAVQEQIECRVLGLFSIVCAI